MNNAELLKELRSLTQAGMKDCNDALKEAQGDLQKAVDIIKTKGKNIVSGRDGKVAAEGMVVVSQGGPCQLSAMVEVNCQTDFVANSQSFKDFAYLTVDALQKTVLENKDFTTQLVELERQNVVSSTKENIVVRRWWVEEALDPKARVFTYVHSNNKIGVLLTLLAPSEQAATSQTFIDLGNDLAMQVAAMNPIAVSSEKIDAEITERQKGIFEAQLKELNKPAATWDKIITGKLNKWHSEVCLLDQESITTAKTSVKQIIKNVSNQLGAEVLVSNFVRCAVGEGLETAQTDYVAEVAQLSGL